MVSGQELQRLEEIMKQLRGENGCPWDRKQTHQSLRPYLLEEAYEVLEAIEEDCSEHLQEELGDLLLQVVFHAQIGEEEEQFTLADVLRKLNAKLIRRHPHVFGEKEVDGVEGVMATWEEIKAAEKKERPVCALDGIPSNFPALMRAEKMQAKAARLGFDWKEINGPLEKIKEEGEELVKAWKLWMKGQKQEQFTQVEEEFGDLLFSLVNLSRFLGIRSELALNRACDKFYHRFQQMEESAAANGVNFNQLTFAQMDELWEKSKKRP